MPGRPQTDLSLDDPAREVLALFLDGGELSATAIAELTSQSRASADRIAALLAGLDLLHRDDAGLFRAGALIRFVTDPLVRDGRSAGPDVLSALTGINHGRARVGVLQTSGVTYLERSFGTSPDRTFSAAGSMKAAQSALGQVLLAYSLDGIAGRFLDREAGTSTRHRDELELALSVVKLSGVAMTHGEPPALDIAVPVFGPAGRVEVALEIQVNGFPDAQGELLDALRQLAAELSPSALPNR